jgi:hypothetical protein
MAWHFFFKKKGYDKNLRSQTTLFQTSLWFVFLDAFKLFLRDEQRPTNVSSSTISNESGEYNDVVVSKRDF